MHATCLLLTTASELAAVAKEAAAVASLVESYETVSWGAASPTGAAISGMFGAELYASKSKSCLFSNGDAIANPDRM